MAKYDNIKRDHFLFKAYIQHVGASPDSQTVRGRSLSLREERVRASDLGPSF